MTQGKDCERDLIALMWGSAVGAFARIQVKLDFNNKETAWMSFCLVISVRIQHFKILLTGRGKDSDCGYAYTDKSFSSCFIWLSVPVIMYSALCY